MRSRGIWLTVLMRGVQLNSLTPGGGSSRYLDGEVASL